MTENKGYQNEELEIDLLDLLAQLFLRWKWILGGMLLCAALFAVVTGLRGEKKPVVEEVAIESARSQLTEEEIAQVDYTYAQYLSYKQYKQSMQTYLAASLYSSDTFSADVIKRTMFSVGSEINGAGSLFTKLAIGKEEYAQVAQLLLGTGDLTEEIFQRVYLETPNGVSGLQEVSGFGENGLQKETLLTLTVIASDQEKADEAAEYLEGVLRQKYEEFADTYPDMTFRKIGSQYSYDVLDFLQSRQNTVMSNLNAADSALTNLDTNVISKMDSQSKAYYQLLVDRDEAEKAVIRRPRYLRNTVLGALLGVILTAGIICVLYVMNGTVKTASELRWILRGEFPALVYYGEKKIGLNIFRGIARRIRSGKKGVKTTTEEMLSEDLRIRLEKQGKQKIYLINDGLGEKGTALAEQIRQSLESGEKKISVQTGDPISSAAELEQLSASDAAILLVQLKKTSRTALQRMVQHCVSYGVDISGVAAFEEEH